MRLLIHFESDSRAGQVEVYPVRRSDRLTLGRGEGCELRFGERGHEGVSRHHAMIEWTADDGEWRFEISDLLSRNGTYVNGYKVDGSLPLSSGDRIELGLGGPLLRIEIEQPEPTRPANSTRQIPRVQV